MEAWSVMKLGSAVGFEKDTGRAKLPLEADNLVVFKWPKSTPAADEPPMQALRQGVGQ
jgi:hypothetical protein